MQQIFVFIEEIRSFKTKRSDCPRLKKFSRESRQRHRQPAAAVVAVAEEGAGAGAGEQRDEVNFSVVAINPIMKIVQESF